MNKKSISIIMIILGLILALGYFVQTIPPESEIIQVSMKNNADEEIGVIDLVETKAGVMVRLDLHGLPARDDTEVAPFEHAIHVHETGDCSPQETFKNAGGHFNPHSKMHGMKHPEGQHAGDMPNLKPNKDGVIKTQFLNKHITTLDKDVGHRASVFDDDGSSIIIHAGADDHMSQPSGAAGARIACGVIKQAD
jgi:Cu-Zn family superoxide dismutase